MAHTPFDPRRRQYLNADREPRIVTNIVAGVLVAGTLVILGSIMNNSLRETGYNILSVFYSHPTITQSNVISRREEINLLDTRYTLPMKTQIMVNPNDNNKFTQTNSRQ